MKVKDVVIEALEKHPDFEAMSRPKKLLTKSVIGRQMTQLLNQALAGAAEEDIPDEELPAIRSQIQAVMATLPLDEAEGTP